MFHRTTHRILLASLACTLCLTWIPNAAHAQEGDILREALFPYIPGRQRASFLGAAGVDSELDKAEFESAAKRSGGFLRSYDRWELLARFDASGDGKIDWFEADAYRRSMREAVLNEYDASRNGRLEGDELATARKDLASGKLPQFGPAGRAGNQQRGAGAFNQEAFLEFAQNIQANPAALQFTRIPEFDGAGNLLGLPQAFLGLMDRDGDGKISQDERLDLGMAIYEQAESAIRNELDLNGDGQVTQDEINQTPPPVQFLLEIAQTVIKDYDENGDGRISRDEAKMMDEDMQYYMKKSQASSIALLDDDGDGQIGPAEFQAFQSKSQMAVFSVLPRLTSSVDANGDGRITEEEGMQVFNGIRTRVTTQMSDFRKQFDADGDGRLTTSERRKAMDGLIDWNDQLVTKHDKDGDGKLSTNELGTLYIDTFEQFGILAPRE